MAFESWKERTEKLESEVYALYLALRDSRTPLLAKVVIVLIVGYVASPIDPIPDFVPLLGYLDELLVVPGGVAIALRLVPEEVMAECRERVSEEIDIGRARWVVAVFVVLLWLIIGIVALRSVTDLL